jgi:hypothetical protein
MSGSAVLDKDDFVVGILGTTVLNGAVGVCRWLEQLPPTFGWDSLRAKAIFGDLGFGWPDYVGREAKETADWFFEKYNPIVGPIQQGALDRLEAFLKGQTMDAAARVHLLDQAKASMEDPAKGGFAIVTVKEQVVGLARFTPQPEKVIRMDDLLLDHKVGGVGLPEALVNVTMARARELNAERLRVELKSGLPVEGDLWRRLHWKSEDGGRFFSKVVSDE